jgi:heterodisulfide reductase subunit B
MAAIGAEPVDFSHRLRCCGGSLLITSRPAAFQLIYELLRSAENSQADVIATSCPMCQTNLECYQMQINQEYGTDFKMPVLYFTQLIGLAMGIPPKKLGIGTEFVSADRIVRFAKEPA